MSTHLHRNDYGNFRQFEAVRRNSFVDPGAGYSTYNQPGGDLGADIYTPQNSKSRKWLKASLIAGGTIAAVGAGAFAYKKLGIGGKLAQLEWAQRLMNSTWVQKTWPFLEKAASKIPLAAVGAKFSQCWHSVKIGTLKGFDKLKGLFTSKPNA
jgi:hypothetical protein